MASIDFNLLTGAGLWGEGLPSAPLADLSLDDPQNLPGVFSRVAAQSPNAIAVKHGRDCMTYGELDTLSNRIAHWLQQAHRVERGDLVCIGYPRGVDFMVAMLAVLKCGAAYVPLDLREPLERRRMIVEDAKPKCLIVVEEKQKDFEFSGALCSPIALADLKDIYSWPPEPLGVYVDSEDPCCVFFTSGSTGRPKGVLLPHIAISGLILSPRYLSISNGDRVLSSSSIAFDAASFEIWTALLNGAMLVCVDYECLINPEAFANFIAQNMITIMWVTTALFDQLVAFRPGIFSGVKYLLSGGDVVSPKTVQKVLSYPGGRPRAFVNGYGPTEAGILATFYVVTELDDASTPLPIGRPLADTVLYVLDHEQKPVPCGEAGELYIGGHRLAKGYLNLPEKTASQFLVNPFSGDPFDRLYRTGDLVRFRDDGNLCFLGRADRQIKFRGFRIELDGLEQVLINHEAIANAAVVMVKNKEQKVLVGYLQPELNYAHSFDLAEYRNWLSGQLPDYSVPAVLTVVEALPLTPRGKIDRQQLPEPVFENQRVTEAVAPRTATEQLLWDVWSECLANKEIGVTDDFFEVGGDSILVATVYSLIREKINRPFDLDAFFQSPTIESLAKVIDGLGGYEDQELKRRTLMEDAVLDPEVVPRWSDVQAVDDVSSVLLTGSTGFLGAHLLSTLLRDFNVPIYCLLRPGNGASNSLRVKQLESLDRYGLGDIELDDRFRPIACDLGKSGLDLSRAHAQRLRSECSHVIHCGAFVNHGFGYERLRAANATSTLELIRLSMSGRAKKLSLISTVSAVSEADVQGLGCEDEVSAQPSEAFGGYALSKWVAERLMRQSFDRGLDGLILRPGNIFASDHSGVASSVDTNFSLLMMRSYLTTGLAPDLDLVYEAVPVDRLAEAVVALTMDANTNQKALNLSNPHVISLSDYLRVLEGISGRLIKIVPYEQWQRDVILPLKPDSPLYPLALYFQGEPAQEIQRFHVESAMECMQRLGVEFSGDYPEMLGRAYCATLRSTMGL